MNERRLENQHILFLIFFSLVSWFFFSSLLMNQKLFDLFYYFQSEEKVLSKSFDERTIPVIVTNPKKTKEEKSDPSEQLYRSNRNAQAQGRLTKKKGFQWLSEQEKIKIRNSQKIQPKETNEGEDILTTKLLYEDQLLWNQFKKKKKYHELMRIPDSYDFNYKHAFSWNRDGSPQIPSYHYKHYKYIKAMMNKIRYNWARPGGIPTSIYGDDYHGSYYVPGYIRLRLFPPQEIGIVFMLDKHGEVMDIKVKRSNGYKTLDNSLVEAIRNAQNFGPPPKDFMQSFDRAFFPWIFKIY